MTPPQAGLIGPLEVGREMIEELKGNTAAKAFVLLMLSPFLLTLGLVLLLGLPFYWLYRLLLRSLVEMLWVRRGKRILFIYSRSPVWQDYIETAWLPRIQRHAVILNWSDRVKWRHSVGLAACVFRHWAPSTDFNPMVIVFPAFPHTRRIGFYYAFRDWKHGNQRALRAAETQLFEFIDGSREVPDVGKA